MNVRIHIHIHRLTLSGHYIRIGPLLWGHGVDDGLVLLELLLEVVYVLLLYVLGHACKGSGGRELSYMGEIWVKITRLRVE